MTKGKHAAHSANQRYQEALVLIDSLTDQLASVKLRAREAEAEAAKVPHLLVTVERLSRLADDEETSALSAQRRQSAMKMTAVLQERDAAVDLCVGILRSLRSEANRGVLCEDACLFTESMVQTLRANGSFSPIANAISPVGRGERRSRSRVTSEGQVLTEAQRKAFRDRLGA